MRPDKSGILCPDFHYPVRVRKGRCGGWSITSCKVSPENAAQINAGYEYAHGEREAHALQIAPGRYWVLKHADTIWMSNTQLEARTSIGFVRAAKGRVLVTGLGLGMIVDALLAKPEVTGITVLELSPEVITLVGPLYDNEPRVRLIQADAFTWTPPAGETWDWAWHDIWPRIDPENFRQMAALEERFRPYAARQRCWASALVRRQMQALGGDPCRSWIEAQNQVVADLSAEAARRTETPDGMRF